MERFKLFIGKHLKIEKIKGDEILKPYSLICQQMPENIEEFEEIEFIVDDIVMCIAVLEGKIKRIMLVKVSKENPEICSPLTKEELNKFLQKNEDNLVKFFENITF